MSESWMQSLLVNWGPMIVLMAVWVFYMSLFGGRARRFQSRQEQHMERIENLLERIVVGLERRGP